MKTFVGIGFGPIQSGLFVSEAYRSGNFDRLTVAEVDESTVRAVRDSGGMARRRRGTDRRAGRFERGGFTLKDMC